MFVKDNFDRANQVALTSSTWWSGRFSNVVDNQCHKLTSNQAQGSTGGTDHQMATQWNPNQPFAPDQEAAIVTGSAGIGVYNGIILRSKMGSTPTNGWYYYAAADSANYFYIGKVIAGTNVNLAGVVTPLIAFPAGTRLMFRATGSLLEAYYNVGENTLDRKNDGPLVLRCAVVDTTLTAGQPGIYSSGNNGNTKVDDFFATDELYRYHGGFMFGL